MVGDWLVENFDEGEIRSIGSTSDETTGVRPAPPEARVLPKCVAARRYDGHPPVGRDVFVEVSNVGAECGDLVWSTAQVFDIDKSESSVARTWCHATSVKPTRLSWNEHACSVSK